ncbi:GTP-binding protein 1 [Beauveria bassiana]|uniref:GTP-binding protein 1 n=1 Tax=Beauveria bassiana TaxID=176275 RepID=A0A2N6NCK0_BEABA|nr:GTP-binding protein 1 [Beauveria bassiana]
MATKATKALPHEKRKGESALSQFAEYVEQQQSRRFPAAPPTPADSTEHHEELDDLFDGLDLADTTSRRLMKPLLLGSDEESIEQLQNILVERIVEGLGEAILELGYEDNGEPMNLTLGLWNIAYKRIELAAKNINAVCLLLLTNNVGGEAEAASTPAAPAKGKSCTGKVLLRRAPNKIEDAIETRIAVVGNGVLVKGDLDDGRGKARVNLFRHKHEMESGRTSSVGMEILGFDAAGKVVTSDTPGRKLSWEEIGKRSAKVITFTDLAGHERYLRTTVFGMLSSSPNYCVLMVAANHGLTAMSKEHLGIALALNVPVMVIITKIDICPPHVLAESVKQITGIMKSPGARKIPTFINSREDCINTATQFVSHRICPIFQVSNVTGQNLDLVRLFFNILPHHGRYNSEGPFEFQVNDTFSVPFTGTVVSGIIKSGVIHEGDNVLIGPDSLGQFSPTAIRSIERKRLRVPAASAGQSASFALKKVKRKDVRKGMVVLPHLEGEAPPVVHREFVAEGESRQVWLSKLIMANTDFQVLILSHATTIKRKYQAMLHVGPVSQTCAVIDIDRDFIRTGDRATVAFRFVQRPEYLAPGDRLLFREGRTKGLGIVKSVGYDPKHPLSGEPAGDEGDANRVGEKTGE